MKQRIHRMLGPGPHDDPADRAVHRFLFSLIGLNVVVVVLETVEPIRAAAPRAFWWFEAVSVAIFTVEYLLRVWTATLEPGFHRPLWGRLKWMATPLAIVDLLAIVPFYLPFMTDDARALRVLRVLRLLRLFRLARFSRTIALIGDVVSEKRQELTVSAVFLVTLLLISSSLMYYAENAAQPDKFASIPESMWWAVITLTTIGYGDVYPVTGFGRLLAGVIAISGIALFTLPAGILAAGFTDRIQRERNARSQAADPQRCPHCGGPVP